MQILNNSDIKTENLNQNTNVKKKNRRKFMLI